MNANLVCALRNHFVPNWTSAITLTRIFDIYFSCSHCFEVNGRWLDVCTMRNRSSEMVSLIVFQGKEVDLAHLSYLPEEHFSCPDWMLVDISRNRYHRVIQPLLLCHSGFISFVPLQCTDRCTPVNSSLHCSAQIDSLQCNEPFTV